MCSGGGPSGPSSSDMKKQEKAQKRSEKQMQRQYKRTEKKAQKRHNEMVAQNERTFKEGQYNAFQQFKLSQQQQSQQAAMQMQSQMMQFAASQKMAQQQMAAQMMENRRLAKESEMAALKAQGLQPTVNENEARRIKPRDRNPNRSMGTGQLVAKSNPGLSIAG